MKKPILMLAMLAVCASAAAQSQRHVRSYDRSGNEKYEAKHFQDAEMDYRRALNISPSDSVARFNLATTLIRQQDQAKLAEADSILNGLIMESEQQGNRALSARSLYQKGEIAMMSQQYEQAANAFKESLKRNPSDDDARFNYLLAKKLHENQQQQDQQDKNQQQQKQDQQKQQEKQQQDQQQQNKQDQQQQQDQQKQQQQQQNQEQQQQNQQKMSQDQQQSILEQNEREEKETQAKVMRRQLDKNNEKKREMEIRRMNGTLKDW